MQPFVLLMMFLLLLHDSLLDGSEPLLHWSGTPWLLAMLVPYVLLAATDFLACSATLKKLKHRDEHDRGSKLFKKLDRLRLILRLAGLCVLLFDLYALGWLLHLRSLWPQTWGYPVIWPELAALAPLLGILGLGWAAAYPVECELRRRMDLPAAAPTRLAYVFMQFRQQLLILLGPMFLLVGWAQTVEHWIGPHMPDFWRPWLSGAGALAVFVFSPFLLRWLWKTSSLPDGELRQKLLSLCNRYRVGVRDLLIWETHHSMANGAVMGLFGKFRFVLLTDQLIRDLAPIEVEAVMAHELGHVRHKHMIRMVICALAVLAAASWVLELGIGGLESLVGTEELENFLNASPVWSLSLNLALLGTIGGVWFAAFGWISRRFERQADTFAARHLSGEAEYFDPQAAEAVAGALGRVADLNHLDVARKSWRHGSIAWRCRYLRSLGGQPAQPARIDRQIRWICAIALLVLSLVTAYEMFLI